MTLAELKRKTSVPVVVVDSQGVVLFVNAAFEAALGWPASDIVGSSLNLIIPEYLRDAHNLGFSRFLTTETPTLLNRPIALKALTRDGRELLAEHFIMAEKDGDKWFFGATIQIPENRDQVNDV